MTRKRRIVEWSKSLLIVLLSCSALALAVMASVNEVATESPLISHLTQLFGTSTGETAGETETGVQAASRPVQISLRTEAGRTSAMFDEQELASLYERFGGALGQALEEAGSAQKSTLSAAQAALQRTSVYFLYPGTVPLSVLALWLEAGYEGDAAASWFALSVRGESVLLYFGDETQTFVSKTYLQPERLERELESVRPDGSAFAFEQSELGALAPLTLLDLAGQHAVFEAEAVSAWNESFVSETASLMGFNPYGDGYYTETDGTVVFSESGRTLRIGTDGSVMLANRAQSDGQFEAEDGTIASQIETARALLESLLGSRAGSASLYLTGAEVSGETVTLTFEYYLNGILIRQASGPAATATLNGTVLSALTVRIRSYRTQASTCTLLPVRQAAALTDVGCLMIGYADAGDGALAAGWMS